MWKNTVRVGQATDDSMVHAHCMLHTQGYKYTHRLCITYCFFHCNNGFTKALQCYVIHTLPVLSVPYLSTLQTLMYSCLIFSQSSNFISRLITFFMPYPVRIICKYILQTHHYKEYISTETWCLYFPPPPLLHDFCKFVLYITSIWFTANSRLWTYDMAECLEFWRW